MTDDVCTCTWSPISTTSEDPPHIIKIDLNCQRHRLDLLGDGDREVYLYLAEMSSFVQHLDERVNKLETLVCSKRRNKLQP